MKRALVLFLTTFLLILPCGCSKANNDDIIESNEPSSTDEPSSTEGMFLISGNMVSEPSENLDANLVSEDNLPNILNIDEINMSDEAISMLDNMVSSDVELPLYNEEGYYITRKSIIHYMAKEQKYSDVYMYFAFGKDEDLHQGVAIYFTLIDGNISSPQITYPIDKNIADALMTQPDMYYLFLYNGAAEVIIDENNKLHNTAYLYNIDVIGDYYHSLNYKKYAISYQDLVKSDNLIYHEVGKHSL